MKKTFKFIAILPIIFVASCGGVELPDISFGDDEDVTLNDPNYEKMYDNFENSLAFKTACDLIFEGKKQPSGYTEPLLHLNRIKKKSNQN